MRLVKLSCPGCCAQMLIDRVNKRAYCEYCGNVMLIEEDPVCVNASASLSQNAPEKNENLEEVRRARLKAAIAASDERRKDEAWESMKDTFAHSHAGYVSEYDEELVNGFKIAALVVISLFWFILKLFLL